MSEDRLLFSRLAWQISERLPPAACGSVILLTSARAGEGKSFVAQALAAALCLQGGSSVALVDCGVTKRDASAPGLPSAVNGPSWRDLQAQGSLSDEAWAKITQGAQVVRVEQGQAGAASLFQREALNRVLNSLRQRFAYVIVDGPLWSDCGALAACADGVAIVINANETRREIVKGSLLAHPVQAEKMLGVILNRRPQYVPGWLYRRTL